MDFSFHYLVMAQHSMFQKELLIKLKGLGLTIGQPKILDYLQTHDGAGQKDIACGCHIEPGTLTTLLNRMEENGLVERRMMNGNRRSYYVFMTDKGKKQAHAVAEAFMELEEQAFCGLSDEERTILMELFIKIYHNTMVERKHNHGKTQALYCIFDRTVY